MMRKFTPAVVSVLLLVGLGLSVAQSNATEPSPSPAAEAESEPSPTPETTPSAEPEAEPTSEPEAEPTSEPEAEPSSEPEAESTPEQQPNPEGEPEGGAEPEPEPEGESEPGGRNASDSGSPFAEPVPAWNVALPLYAWAWEFHIYTLGVLFALLALYSLWSIVRLQQRRLLSYGYFITLNLLMFLMGTIRAVYLLVDAYNYKGIWPNVVAYLLLGTGFPCLTSAFSILFLALLQSTKTRLVPPTIQKPKFLAIVVGFHYAFAFIADVVVGMHASAGALLLVCQVGFVVWGLFLTVSYLVIFRRLYRSSQRKFREISRLSKRTASVVIPGERPIISKPRNNWGSAIRLTLITAILGLLIAILQLYGMLVVYGPVGGQNAIPEPWPWWSYQFIFRVLEFSMCLLMSIVATQPFRYTKDGKEKPLPCAACWKSLCGACGRREEMDFKKDEDLNSHVWSSAFEPCLPQKPEMYRGLASSDQEMSGVHQKNVNGNNSSGNVHTEESPAAENAKYLRLELHETQDPERIRRTRSSEVVGSEETSERARTPQTAPAAVLSGAPFMEALRDQAAVVQDDELDSSVGRDDKDTSCPSQQSSPPWQRPTVVDNKPPDHRQPEPANEETLSEHRDSSTTREDLGLHVTEKTPLNPEQSD